MKVVNAVLKNGQCYQECSWRPEGIRLYLYKLKIFFKNDVGALMHYQCSTFLRFICVNVLLIRLNEMIFFTRPPISLAACCFT